MISGWKPDNYLSLSGVYQPRKNIQDTPLPLALARYLETYPQTQEIWLCLDNDEAGKLAAQTLIILLGEKYKIRYLPPAHGKDYNEMLMAEKGIEVNIKMRSARGNHLLERWSYFSEK